MPSADLARRELIGLRCRVAASNDPGLRGVAGTVVDETMKTFTLDTAAGTKVVPKAGQAFEFTLPGGATERLEGRDVAHRPEERTRKARPRSLRRAESPR